jgi:class 3 adenylate cyclase
MEPQPARKLAILFADITGSARLYESLGDVEALQTINHCLAIIKGVCEEQGGRVVKNIGDEAMAVFTSADSAACAAIDMQVRISAQRTSKGATIAIHVGFHFGPVIEDGTDVFGDAVTIASRLVGLAKSGQTLLSTETVADLSPFLQSRMRDQDVQTVKGKQQDIAICELIWQDSSDELTSMSTRQVAPPARLKLWHGSREIELDQNSRALSIGRDLQNDLVIADRKASRMHARIERRRDKFVLIDQSTNGTYHTMQGEPEILLRREELVLRGRGSLSFGHAYTDDPAEFIGFSCLA